MKYKIYQIHNSRFPVSDGHKELIELQIYDSNRNFIRNEFSSMEEAIKVASNVCNSHGIRINAIVTILPVFNPPY